MPYKNPPPCQVCGKPSAAARLCDKHYRRWKKFGNVDATLRPEDWGKRNKHPLNHAWRQTKRNKIGRVKRWDDFWVFVSDVGDRPSPGSKLRRHDVRLPYGPDNFYWSEPILKTPGQLKTLAGRAEYAREWRKRNPVRAKHHAIKKTFGIGLEEYMLLLKRQGGVCCICGGKDEWFNLAVDHCHEKGHVRGLLCSQCNRGIGLFRDKPELLRNAAQYLEGAQRLL